MKNVRTLFIEILQKNETLENFEKSKISKLEIFRFYSIFCEGFQCFFSKMFHLEKNMFCFFQSLTTSSILHIFLDRTKFLESYEPPLSFKHHFYGAATDITLRTKNNRDHAKGNYFFGLMSPDTVHLVPATTQKNARKNVAGNG